ncbi:hypothetical protein [Streptomyces spirodelae]|uniref:Uncharacterized protein n=1 Tax=Streptomyces spirodelae TaxID=2812904 RepID=A0ABS3X1N2_9ACTN|nr:hypothetical protein [Streptomyces spirodelae]MBO8189284.1 hypothetical protein [Streptomyces spirodelae]
METVLVGVITALAAIGGNFFANRQAERQMISDAKLQLREPRKRTYSDFLLACREAHVALVGLWEEETQEADSGRIEHAIDQHRSALQRALAAVSLEGPEVVSEAANKTMKAFNDLHHTALVWNMSGGDTHDDGRPIGFSGDYTGDIRQALDHYLKEARKALTTSADG